MHSVGHLVHCCIDSNFHWVWNWNFSQVGIAGKNSWFKYGYSSQWRFALSWIPILGLPALLQHLKCFIFPLSMSILLFTRQTAGGGEWFLPVPGLLWVCHFRGWVWENFALHRGSLLKSALQQGPFLLKTEVSPLKMHVLQLSKVNTLSRPHAPYLKLGMEILKWHTHIQESGKV